jgi:hypothetical protein
VFPCGIIFTRPWWAATSSPVSLAALRNSQGRPRHVSALSVRAPGRSMRGVTCFPPGAGQGIGMHLFRRWLDSRAGPIPLRRASSLISVRGAFLACSGDMMRDRVLRAGVMRPLILGSTPERAECPNLRDERRDQHRADTAQSGGTVRYPTPRSSRNMSETRQRLPKLHGGRRCLAGATAGGLRVGPGRAGAVTVRLASPGE